MTRTFRALPGDEVFVTSAILETVGRHERLAIWVRGARVGELVLEVGQGATMAAMLGLEEDEAVRQTSEEIAHRNLDVLIAQFLLDTGKLPSTTTMIEFVQWSAECAGRSRRMADEPNAPEVEEG